MAPGTKSTRCCWRGSTMPGASTGREVSSTHRVCRRFWGDGVGPNPTDRGKNGSKYHVMVDAKGTPLTCRVSGANVPDIQGLLPTVVACPLGNHGTEERLPKRLYADRV